MPKFANDSIEQIWFCEKAISAMCHPSSKMPQLTCMPATSENGESDKSTRGCGSFATNYFPPHIPICCNHMYSIIKNLKYPCHCLQDLCMDSDNPPTDPAVIY